MLWRDASQSFPFLRYVETCIVGGFDESRATGLESTNRFSFKNGFSKIVQEIAASK
jgi:hypothetical protein